MQCSADRSLSAAVLFDLDGTLIDTAPDIAWCVEPPLLEHDLPPQGEVAIRYWIGRRVEQLLRSSLATATVHSTTRAVLVGDSTSDVGAAFAAGTPVVCPCFSYNHRAPASDSRLDAVIDEHDQWNSVLSRLLAGMAATPEGPAPESNIMARIGTKADVESH